MRRSIGLKFEADDVDRWDAWAITQGLTRTSLIETAVEHLIGFEDALQAMAAGETDIQIKPPGKTPLPADPAAVGDAIVARDEHLQQHGIQPPGRRAFICTHQTKGVRDCTRRTFLLPDEPDHIPDCPTHGAMSRQPNRAYLGNAT